MSARGLFIAFEGGDGSGKSTQARLLAERLGAELTRNPGGTPLGSRLRDLILDPEMATISPRSEALLFMADRAEQVNALVEPTLRQGRDVVTDRYAYSSIAYQGYGRGLDVEELWSLAEWSVNGCWPDIVFLVDVPVEVGLRRREERDRVEDHYEASGDGLQLAVREAFLSMAESDPSRWRVVDGTGDIASVSERVWAEFEAARRHYAAR